MRKKAKKCSEIRTETALKENAVTKMTLLKKDVSEYLNNLVKEYNEANKDDLTTAQVVDFIGLSTTVFDVQQKFIIFIKQYKQ